MFSSLFLSPNYKLSEPSMFTSIEKIFDAPLPSLSDSLYTKGSSFCHTFILDLEPDEFEVTKTDVSSSSYRITVRSKDGKAIHSVTVASNYDYQANYVNGILLVRFDKKTSTTKELPVDVKVL